MPAPLFHNQYDKYSVHKSAAITEKGRDLRTPRPCWVFQYCSLLSVIMCSQAYSSSQLQQGVPPVLVTIETLHGTSSGRGSSKYFTQAMMGQAA